MPGLRGPLSRDCLPEPLQEAFELGHSFPELPELLGRLFSLGVNPVSEFSELLAGLLALRVNPVSQPAVVPCHDPPHAQQYCCDRAMAVSTVGMIAALSMVFLSVR